MAKERIQTEMAPRAMGPYSQAIRVHNFVHTAGVIGIDPSTGALASGIAAQTHQALKNIGAVLDAAGSSLANAVKTTVYLTDLANFAEMNGIYGGYFGDVPPARTTIQVAALPGGALVEIECMAVVD